jgi:two-component system chemotaxis sensor kinase CheA
MLSEQLLIMIESVSEELVTADPDDLRDLVKIHECFLEILKETQTCRLYGIADVAEQAAEIVNNIILDEKADREGAFDLLNKKVSAIQQLSRPGADPDQIDLNGSIHLNNEEEEGKVKKYFSLPPHLDEDIFIEFLNEQDSVLERMESHLLSLEKKKDRDTLADLRRIFHTLKGESAIFELNTIQRLCHITEDLINPEGDDYLPIDKLLSVKDWLKNVFDALKNNTEIPEINKEVRSILSPETSEIFGLEEEQKTIEKSVFDDNNFKEKRVSEELTDQKKQAAKNISDDIDLLTDFVSEAQEHIDNIDNKLLSLENNPMDRDLLNAVFRVFHTIKGAAGFLALDDIAKLSHITENLLHLARKGEVILSGGKIDVVFEALDAMKKLVSDIKIAISSGSKSYITDPSLGKLLVKIQNTTDEVQSEAYQPEPDQKETADADVINKNESQQTKVKIKESIKVDSENLDKLVDAIGELVIIESMIKQDPDLTSNVSSRLIRNITQMDKITRELQQIGMSLRMIPVKATFQKMARIVRDLAKKEDKKIEFKVNGEDTMLDKSVVDRISDPLIHLVRNSVDHGIEKTPQDRNEAGKSKTGRIELTAFHKGGNIHIEIIDDGRGLDKDAILQKAIEKGLIREGQNLSDKEIYNLVLLPGFSTADKITDISGRGVGMDVVKRNVTDLRGNIDISSSPGQGSRFSLRLPLTLAIIDGMLVRIGDERYIIPTLSIVKSIRPTKDKINTVIDRGEMITVQNDLIPLFRLAKLFEIEGAKQDPTESIVIVVEDSGKMAGVLVDELLGQQSTVIKNLGSSMKGLPGISGGSIMSDGQVGIILDVPGLVKLATIH